MNPPDIEIPNNVPSVWDPLRLMWRVEFDHISPVFDWNIIPQVLGTSAASLLSVESLHVVEGLLRATLTSYTVSFEVLEEADFQEFSRVLSEV